ncbi:MAG: A/G-specific adenine glycosylase [Limisphaerales bacterium]
MPSKSASSKSKVQSPKSRRAAALAAVPSSLVPTLLEWFSSAARDLPWRHTLDPYAIWVSEIMLQQTQVKTVIPYWERWMRDLPDVGALAAASEQRLLKLWDGLGYYSRVRNLQKAAQHIVHAHGGVFPRDFAAILELPGVGRYTAGAIASIAFNAPAPILDGNVIRVLTRLFAVAENPRDKATNERLWQHAEQLVQAAAGAQNPESRIQNLNVAGSCSALNQSLMELGATICTPQNPRCDACPVRTHCVAQRQGRVAELPNLAPRVATTRREFHTFVVERAGKFLVTQRCAGVVNAGLWEFPNLEVTDRHSTPTDSLKQLLQLSAHCEPLCEVRHSITRYRITQRAFRVTLARRPAGLGNGFCWLALPELDALPFSSAHKRVLARLAQASAASLAHQRRRMRR